MNKFTLVSFAVLATLATLGTGAQAAGKHAHGVGQMNVVVEGEALTVTLDLPLDTLVGFERAPRNDKERAALTNAVDLLRTGAVSPAQTSGGCLAEGVTVHNPFAEGATAKSADAHADVSAEYRFRCPTGSGLNGVDVAVFKSFPRLYRLEAQRIGPKGQGGGRLTPKQPGLRW